jgi:Domain of unknown function (DUF397)
MLEQGIYKKSKYSVTDCVLVALLPGETVGVRNSRDDKDAHTYTREEWTAFIAGIKNGAFDYRA